jgi:hypothetical protein
MRGTSDVDPPHSTENEVAKALRAIGHEVLQLQENRPDTWDQPAALLDRLAPDVFLWTRTGWDWQHCAGWSWEQATDHQRQMLAECRGRGIPTVGYHLDRWHGLDREGQIRNEPFFGVDLLCTADGGHDEQWAAAGINHRWFPPGVSEFECGGGTFNRRLASDVAFCGSWRPGYHQEWAHRPELVDFLRRTYSQRCRFWGGPGRSMRGRQLRDLYASVKVLVGDSCLAGGATHYWSDRIPETLGRGGFLLHPYVEGIEGHYIDGVHLRLWPLGDWAELRRLIDYYVAHDEERRAIAEAGRRHVLEQHTYTVRMQRLEATLVAEGLLDAASAA